MGEVLMNHEKTVRNIKKFLDYFLLLVIGLVWIYPFLWMVSASFKSQPEFFENRLGLIPQNPTLDNVIRIWEKANFSTYFINTVIVTIFAVIIVLIMTMLAKLRKQAQELPRLVHQWRNQPSNKRCYRSIPRNG